jgi:hypothetical protein
MLRMRLMILSHSENALNDFKRTLEKIKKKPKCLIFSNLLVQ